MRALMIPSAVGRAHRNRLLLIARALRETGVQVTFAFKEQDAALRDEGFEVLSVPDVTVTDFDANVYAAYTPDFVVECVDAERAAIERVLPDVVVSDFRPSAAITTRLTGVRHTVIVNAYLTRHFDPVDALLPVGPVVKRRAASALGGLVQTHQKHELAAPFRVAARRLGVRGLDTLDDFFDGDLVLIADVPDFCSLRGLPPRAQYIGPLVWEGPRRSQTATPFPSQWRDPSRPLVYATTGNTGNARIADLVLNAFADDPVYQVVLTTGDYVQPAGRTVAPNIRVERFVPGSAVLADSVAAIHCGGNGSTYQALGCGVPAVVIPSNTDQRINAYLVRNRHVGLPLKLDGLEPVQLRAAVEVVGKDQQLRADAQRFQQLLAGRDGARAAEQLISSAGQ